MKINFYFKNKYLRSIVIHCDLRRSIPQRAPKADSLPSIAQARAPENRSRLLPPLDKPNHAEARFVATPSCRNVGDRTGIAIKLAKKYGRSIVRVFDPYQAFAYAGLRIARELTVIALKRAAQCSPSSGAIPNWTGPRYSGEKSRVRGSGPNAIINATVVASTAPAPKARLLPPMFHSRPAPELASSDATPSTK